MTIELLHLWPGGNRSNSMNLSRVPKKRPLLRLLEFSFIIVDHHQVTGIIHLMYKTHKHSCITIISIQLKCIKAHRGIYILAVTTAHYSDISTERETRNASLFLTTSRFWTRQNMIISYDL